MNILFKKNLSNLLYFAFLSIIVIYGLFSIRNFNQLPLGGIINIFLSLSICFKCRKSKYLFLVFFIIAFININVCINDFIKYYIPIRDWQLDIRQSVYNVISCKSMIIFLYVLHFFIPNYKKKTNFNFIDTIPKRTVLSNTLLILATVLILIIFVPKVIYHNNSSGYASNNSSLSEYLPLLIFFSFLFDQKSILKRMFVLLISFIYCFFALIIGDRSSVVLMLLIVILSFFEKNITVFRTILLSVFGMVFMNLIGILRDGNIPNIEYLLSNVVERGLSSDTCSFSYYAGLCVVGYHEEVGMNIAHFWNFVVGIFVGGANTSMSINLCDVAMEYSTRFFNYHGGFVFQHFYGWFGYFGVVLSAVLLGLYCRFLIRPSQHKLIKTVLRISFIAFEFRWYIYTPFNLLRSAIFIPIVLCFVFLFLSHVRYKNEVRNGFKYEKI